MLPLDLSLDAGGMDTRGGIALKALIAGTDNWAEFDEKDINDFDDDEPNPA